MRLRGTRLLPGVLLAVGVFVMSTVSAQAANPLAWAAPQEIAANSSIETVICESTSECTAFSQETAFTTARTFSPSDLGVQTDVAVGDLLAAACPTTGLCVAATEAGVVTFDPTSTAAPQSIDPFTGQSPDQVDLVCPTGNECVAGISVGNDWQVVAFDPTTGAPGTVVLTLDTIDDDGLVGLACPAADQCTAITGQDTAETFDPQVAAGPDTPSPTELSLGRTVEGLQCPSPSDCVTVTDYAVLSFNPDASAAPSSATLPSALTTGFSCPAATECVGVDGSEAYEGNPLSAAKWTELDADGRGPGLGSVSCPSATLCVAAEQGANVLIGRPGPAPDGRASVVKLTQTATGVRVTLTCVGASADRCVFTLSLAAGTRSGPAALRTVTTRPGTDTVTMVMTARARRLLARDHTLRARLTVTQTVYDATVVLVRQSFTLYAK